MCKPGGRLSLPLKRSSAGPSLDPSERSILFRVSGFVSMPAANMGKFATANVKLKAFLSIFCGIRSLFPDPFHDMGRHDFDASLSVSIRRKEDCNPMDPNGTTCRTRRFLKCTTITRNAIGTIGERWVAVGFGVARWPVRLFCVIPVFRTLSFW